MGTITVLDSVGASQTVAKVTGTGATTGTNALPVVNATDDVMLGIVTETAPASDTASSGLNGRLQRIAQRITSLIAQIPASLGIKTAAASMSITMASDDALLAKFPASLGVKAAASSLAITQSTEDAAQMGATNETAAATDTTTSGLNGLLKRIAQNLTTVNTTLVATNTQLSPTPSGVVQATITRPANTTAYTASDVLGGAITLATGLTSGQRGMLLSVDLQPQIAALPSGMTTFRLHLYNVTPPSAIADNGAFDIPSGDRASYLGFVTLTTPVDYGSTIYTQVDALNRPFVLSGSANLFAYLETVGAFTPNANSEVYLLRCHFLGI